MNHLPLLHDNKRFFPKCLSKLFVLLRPGGRVILGRSQEASTSSIFFKVFLLFLFIALLLTGCDGFLSNVEPSNDLAIDEVFSTASDLEAALVGAYDGVQHGSLMGRNTVLFADLLTSNVDYQSGSFLNLALLQMDPTDFYVENLWAQAYKTINHLNAILEAIPRVASSDATLTLEVADRIKGEALFLRGVIYFELVRLFCQPIGAGVHQELGLPILIKAILTQDQFQFPARKSVAEVYVQANTDLEAASTLLPAETEPYRANRFAAMAYLARIAFQKEDYETVTILTEEVLKNNLYALTALPHEFFSEEGSEEEIWTIYNSPGDDIEGLGLSSVYHPTGLNLAFISTDLRVAGYQAIVSNEQMNFLPNTSYRIIDLRADTGLLTNYPLISKDTLRTNKYENAALAFEDDSPIARLAEFVLMRAEALVRINGINSESIELLNHVRQRSLRVVDGNSRETPDGDMYFTYKIEDFSNPSELIEAIILERRVELAFEGNYFHDLMRLRREVKGRPFDAPELRLPIPQREMDANPNLVQNPGY